MNEKMASSEGRAVYKDRKIIVEPVFGQIKNLGFKGFSVRSHLKVAGEFALMCASHNLKKIATAMAKGLVCPEYGNAVQNPILKGWVWPENRQKKPRKANNDTFCMLS